nr:enoyl-CoA hydratase-related protein [Mycolicibacterium baixiangningiae]
MSDDGSVRAVRDGAVLHLTLDRPERRNSLSHSMTDALVEVLTAAATDDTLRALHITGEGDDFCAGADWVATSAGGQERSDPGKGTGTHERPRTADLVRRIPHTSHRVIELLHGIHLPVVCSVRGWAVGLGCNLALVADFAVAADDAVFWEPFIARGFSPDSGASWLLPRLIGVARAKRMLLLGEKVNAADAAEWGLIHRAVPRDALDATVAELLTRLADGPTVALGLAKQAIHHGQHTTLGATMTQELFNLELSCRTSDFKEGLAAFQERRAPDFRGR